MNEYFKNVNVEEGMGVGRRKSEDKKKKSLLPGLENEVFHQLEQRLMY
jgi:hypothetical protein